MAVTQPEAESASTEGNGSETIETLFEALESPLLGYARRLTGTADIAEDIVQESFMKLHAQFDQVQKPRPWLYRTVHNLALNHHRNNRRIVPLFASNGTDNEEPNAVNTIEAVDPKHLPDEELVRREGIDQVLVSLETLDERSQELIRLKFNEDLSYKEISDRTGLKTGHVGYLLHHALKTIAASLARTGIVP